MRAMTNIAAIDDETITISFTVDEDAPDVIRNYAEISSDNGDDCDSTPDNTNGNQVVETATNGMVDDQIGNGCNPGGDEDDHDIATIRLNEAPAPSILIDKLDANPSLDQDGVV